MKLSGLSFLALLMWVANLVYAAEGRTPGLFSVSAAGGATYTIPLWTPPGIAKIQQKLSLNYNSHTGNGLLGVGWSVSGLSTIQRCNLTFAQDGVAGSPQLTSADRFCMDGNRLRSTNGTYGADGSTYQTEIANFSNVISHGTAGTGPAYFTVQGRDGLTYEYGNTSDSAIAAGGGAVATIRTWALDKVTDRYGNSIHYVYTNDTANGTYRIADIFYPYTATGQGPFYDVHFTYATRPTADTLIHYVTGYPATETQRLTTISMQWQNAGWQLVKRYTLTYGSGGSSNRSRISQIQECSATDCLLPTTIAYQNATAGLGSEVSTGQTLGNVAGSQLIDMNGDGFVDIVYPNGATYFVMLGSATGFGSPIDTGASSTNYASALPIDFNSDGKMDLLIPNASNNWRILQSTGTSFTVIDTSVPATGAGGNAWVGDMDGDGRPDLLYVPNPLAYGASIMVRYNTGTTFSSTETQVYQLDSTSLFSESGGAFGSVQQIYLSSLRVADFDGDGRVDIVVKYQDDTGDGIFVHELLVLLSRGNTFVVGYGYVSLNKMIGPYVGDFNGDGYADLLFAPHAGLGYTQVNGTGSGPLVASTTGLSANALPTVALDWDGDGRTDLLYEGVVGSTFTWFVATSTGNGFAAGVSTGIATASTVYVADVNGDGLADWVYPDANNVLQFRLHAGVTSDLVSSFTDGYGNSANPTYVSMVRGNYSDYTFASPVYPYRKYVVPLNVVAQATFSDPTGPPGSTYYQTYSYIGSWANVQGRGFSNFINYQKYDSRNNMWELFCHEVAFPYTGMQACDQLSQDQAGNQLISLTGGNHALTTLDGSPYNQRYFPYYSNATSQIYEVGGSKNGQLIRTSSTNYAYDNYGNATTVATTITDNDSTSPYYGQSWSQTATISPDIDSAGAQNVDLAAWCLPLIDSVVTAFTGPSGTAPVTRTQQFTPDASRCHNTQVITEPNSSTYRVTETFGFDSFGNVNSDTVTGAGMAARQTLINWGTAGQFPMVVTDATGAPTQFNYQFDFGLPSSVTDPNGLTTSWLYADGGFGRKTRENRPDGTSVVWNYADCTVAGGCLPWVHGPVVSQVVQNVDGSVQTSGTTYFDEIERPLFSNKLLMDGTYDRNEVRYDSLGRVVQQAAPCAWTASSPCPYWTTVTYDQMNRAINTQRPVSASNSTLETTTISYQGDTIVTTDPQLNVTTKITTPVGTLGRSQDHNGYYHNFVYDAYGSLTAVSDSLGKSLSATTYDYGVQPFQRTFADADLGSRSFTYDALGELTNWSDTKGQSFSAAYDALSRMTDRYEPDLYSHWVWGTNAAAYEVGKLKSICSGLGTNPTNCTGSPGYSEAETYDNKGRLSQRAIQIPSDLTYTYTWQYNTNTGLLDTLNYPANPSGYALQLKYGYAAGILQSITNVSDTPNVALWTANAENPRRQITQATLGNGVVMNRSFDAVTGWVNSIQAGVAGGAALQNQSYLFDLVGNVTQRQDNNLGFTESFYYDHVYRLDHSTLGGTTNLAMGYDSTGNITSRSDIASGAAWNYGTSRAHAVTQAGSSAYTYSYDANGNAVSRNGLAINWTSYNHPSLINSAGGESVQFAYDPSHERFKAVYSGSTGTETTYFIGGLLEKVVGVGVTDYRHYIYAQGAKVAIYSRTTAGANTMRYLLEDHEGSICAILSSTGNSYVKESFTAFGNRRSACTWTGQPTDGNLTLINGVTRHGYTWQEALGSMGLNDMHGRIQDSVTGRFLSPDPYVTQPGFTQSFNRYSYVNNNPLSFTDPTGFSTEESSQTEYENGPAEVVVTGRSWSQPGGGDGLSLQIFSNDPTSRGTASASDPSTVVVRHNKSALANFALDIAFEVTVSADRRSSTGFGPWRSWGDFWVDVRQVWDSPWPGSGGLEGQLAALPLVTIEAKAEEGAADLVTVTHFTSAEGAAAIETSGALRAGSFVTFPSQVSGLSATEVESALEIQSGRGAFSTSFQTPASNLGPAFNGTYTSGGALQFQLNGPVSIAPGSFLPVGPK